MAGVSPDRLGGGVISEGAIELVRIATQEVLGFEEVLSTLN
jgi:hypothetical protein